MPLFLTASGVSVLLSVFAGSLAAVFLRSAPFVVQPRLLEFRLVHNAGVVFGVVLPERVQWVLIILAMSLVLALAMRARSALSLVGLGSIFGGACANIIDRLGDGMVTDFIAVGSFPVFNIADSCITVGMVLLLLEQLQGKLLQGTLRSL